MKSTEPSKFSVRKGTGTLEFGWMTVWERSSRTARCGYVGERCVKLGRLVGVGVGAGVGAGVGVGVGVGASSEGEWFEVLVSGEEEETEGVAEVGCFRCQKYSMAAVDSTASSVHSSVDWSKLATIISFARVFFQLLYKQIMGHI